jgi:hypothetical protein
MRRVVGVLALLSASACSFPICQNCHATVNVDAATVIINTCVVVEYSDGGVTPCHVADAGNNEESE